MGSLENGTGPDDGVVAEAGLRFRLVSGDNCCLVGNGRGVCTSGIGDRPYVSHCEVAGTSDGLCLRDIKKKQY